MSSRYKPSSGLSEKNRSRYAPFRWILPCIDLLTEVGTELSPVSVPASLPVSLEPGLRGRIVSGWRDFETWAFRSIFSDQYKVRVLLKNFNQIADWLVLFVYYGSVPRYHGWVPVLVCRHITWQYAAGDEPPVSRASIPDRINEY